MIFNMASIHRAEYRDLGSAARPAAAAAPTTELWFFGLLGFGRCSAWLTRRQPAAREQGEQRDDSEHRQGRAQPGEAGVRVLLDDRVGSLRGHPGLIERGLEVVIGHEGDATG